MPSPVLIADLMQHSGVKFGTSGARGLASAMTDDICYMYTRAFLQHLIDHHGLQQHSRVAIAGDFRSSTPRIMQAVATAIDDAGFEVIHCGFIPTPALAYYAIARAIPSIMVTGSHIPDDRNGIKFYRADGEILKSDEVSIASYTVNPPTTKTLASLPAITAEAEAVYCHRYIDFFDKDCLCGQRIGVYQHSTVLRDIYVHVLTALGATVVVLGRSEHFIPVDTEAIREQDIALALQWSKEHQLDAIVSADGDGDRPLISDEHGQWLRGDVAGILCARYLSADAVVTPISSNTAVEKSGDFQQVQRTRIGSPYVIAAMQEAVASGYQRVVGYEANGGFLTANAISKNGAVLSPLPTRDALIVPLTILLQAEGKPISLLLQQLPPRFTSSGRIKDMPTASSLALIARLTAGGINAATAWLAPILPAVVHINTTDGLRMTLSNGDIVHLRPSGNAPELRCYNEAGSQSEADSMNAKCLQHLCR